MQQQFQVLRQTRRFVLGLTERLSPAELNHIPAGFNNNVIWNLGHMSAALQGICYARGGAPMQVKPDFFERYKPGTRPEGEVGEAEIAYIRDGFLPMLDQLEADIAAGLFANYTTWEHRFGITTKSIEDAVKFVIYHEGMHAGYMLAMQRAGAAQAAQSVL